ncbi:MAG: hydroxyacid dehydrogenase [Anaerolineae bacterium]|nr:hydroxyacid dehydrogenase [Anaerolineae bacterium]
MAKNHPPRILIVEPDGYAEEALSIYRQLGTVELGDFGQQPLPPTKDIDVLVVRLRHQLDAAWLSQTRGLRVIATPTTGLDHIDLTVARQRGIEVISLKGQLAFLRSIHATAEHTWACLLSLIRHIPPACDSVSQGVWNRDAYRGNELFGKTLGILGLGRVGEKVARYGMCFGMTVAAYDPYRENWVEGVERLDSMDDLLASSQILSIHVPLNEETVGLIGESQLRKLPQGAFLLNTARGEVIDEAALLQVLQEGGLAGAALDVICGERQLDFETNPLLNYARENDHLQITPHIAGATFESMMKTEVYIANRVYNTLK